jgi:CheY-like chemotaxis protein
MQSNALDAPSPAATPLVMVVDDDDNDILLLKRAFRQAGWDVQFEIAHDGEEAISRLNQKLAQGCSLPSLVFLDLKMPNTSGWEVSGGSPSKSPWPPCPSSS